MKMTTRDKIFTAALKYFFIPTVLVTCALLLFFAVVCPIVEIWTGGL